jgi:Uma2 family endonuclease
MATPKTLHRPPCVPPLEPGDHLTRQEFERRYKAMPHIKKAELVEGVVYMPSPVRHESHGDPHANLIWWLKHYTVFTPGVRADVNSTVHLDLDNEPQPDGLMFIEPQCGGSVRISEDDYIEGAPDLVAEVAASTASFDLHTKLRVYRRNQVREYMVWRVLDRTIDWFVLREGEYVPLPLDSAGCYQSEFFVGLWLDAAAMTRSDLAGVLKVLQDGIASPEHAAFVDKLKSAIKPV